MFLPSPVPHHCADEIPLVIGIEIVRDLLVFEADPDRRLDARVGLRDLRALSTSIVMSLAHRLVGAAGVQHASEIEAEIGIVTVIGRRSEIGREMRRNLDVRVVPEATVGDKIGAETGIAPRRDLEAAVRM